MWTRLLAPALLRRQSQAVGAADIDAAAVKLGVRSRGRPATLEELEQDVSRCVVSRM